MSLNDEIRAEVASAVASVLEPYLSRLCGPEPLTYTPVQAARVLGCSQGHVRKLVREDVLPRVPHMGTSVLVPRLAVESLVESALTRGGAAAGSTSNLAAAS